MDTLLRYELDGEVATITLDDGKANVLSPAMLGQIGEALDRAEADHAVVVLAGRDGLFSAGFDLRILQAGGIDAVDMLRGGFELMHRLLSFPTPVVISCTGHAVAAGAFVLLSGDHRVGVAGAAHRIQANEVAIGLTMPRAAIEVCRQRLSPVAFEQAVVLAETFNPDGAVAAGFLDQVVPAADLAVATRATAERFAALDRAAHVGTKLRARARTLAALRDAIEADDTDLRALL